MYLGSTVILIFDSLLAKFSSLSWAYVKRFSVISRTMRVQEQMAVARGLPFLVAMVRSNNIKPQLLDFPNLEDSKFNAQNFFCVSRQVDDLAFYSVDCHKCASNGYLSGSLGIPFN